MAKVVTEGFLADTVNGIKINTSIPCNSKNYQASTNREVKYVAMHYTGNTKDLAVSNAKYFNSTAGTNASAHLFVDDTSIYQSVAYHDRAWHVGAKSYVHKEARNANSIGIEMCCTAGNYTISETTIKNAEYLCAYLCKMLNITAKEVDTYVIRHYDVTGKICPAQMVKNSNEWVAFKQAVKNILNSGSINNTNNDNNGNNGNVTNSYPVPTIALKQGAKGETVKWLQQALNDIGNYGLVVDGSFGAATLKAVKDYQKNNDLDVDGSVGNLTRTSILKSLDNLNTNKNEVKNEVITTSVQASNITDDAKYIWDYCYTKLGNAYGASGLWGNIKAESSLKSNNLQDTYEDKLGYTNASYTKAVDNGSYKNFITDKAGYGICQWTYKTRKQGLYNYAQSKKVSIADLTMQLEYLFMELEEKYPTVLKKLKNAKTVKEASDIVLTDFENPSKQDASVKKVRANYSQEGYDKYTKTASPINIITSTTSTTTSTNSTASVVVTNKNNTTTSASNTSNKLYRVQVGAYLLQNNANNMAVKLKQSGYDSIIVKSGAFYTVQLGAFSNTVNASNLVNELKKKGFNAIIKQS